MSELSTSLPKVWAWLMEHGVGHITIETLVNRFANPKMILYTTSCAANFAC